MAASAGGRRQLKTGTWTDLANPGLRKFYDHEQIKPAWGTKNDGRSACLYKSSLVRDQVEAFYSQPLPSPCQLYNLWLFLFKYKPETYSTASSPLKACCYFFLRERSVLRDDFRAVMLPPVPQTDICPAHWARMFIIWWAFLGVLLGLPVKSLIFPFTKIFGTPAAAVPHAHFMFSELWHLLKWPI